MGWYAGPKSAHLCSHVKHNLKGCNRLAGHEGLHRNIFDTTDERWEDADGVYCETSVDWVKLVDELGTFCHRCNTAIRPEGGHLCGSCGRDI